MNFENIKLPCEIKRVIDGDTVVVDIDHLLNIYSKNARIRLAGIDALSMRTTEGKNAKNELVSMLEGQEITISFQKIKNRQGEKETKKDKFGRYLGTLWIGDENMNLTMVQLGFAKKI